LKWQVVDADRATADALAKVADLETQLANANVTVKALARVVFALNEVDDARAAVVQRL
jgi:hypothetical protein